MSFNPNLPADDSYITSVARMLRNNFNAIVSGDTSFSPSVYNFSVLPEGEDPQATASQAKKFLKKDVYGNLNFFTSLPNAQSGAFAETLMPPFQQSVGVVSGALTLTYTSLLGSYLIGFGIGTGFKNGIILSLTAFEEVICITGNRIAGEGEIYNNTHGVTFTPVGPSSATQKPSKNSFHISIGGSSNPWNCSLIVIGIPDSKFLAQAFANTGSSNNG